MPGCCLIALLMFFGPRVALALMWLWTSWYSAFSSSLVAIAGFVLLPWTSLAWMYTFHRNQGHITGLYAILMVVGVISDLSAYGGHRQYRSWRVRR